MKRKKRDTTLVYIDDVNYFLQELIESPVSHAIDVIRYVASPVVQCQDDSKPCIEDITTEMLNTY